MPYTGLTERLDPPAQTSNLLNILDGIATTLAAATGIGNVVTNLRDGPSNQPLIRIVKPRWRRIPQTYGEQAIEWTLEGTVLLPVANNEQVETDMVTAIVNIINIAGHDLNADGEVADGQFLIESGVTEYGTVPGPTGLIAVLAHRFQIVIVEYIPYTHSL